MPDTKQLRNRIRSVQSTLHLTHAMELVAASKIKRASERMLESRHYADSAYRVMAILCGSAEGNPFLADRGTGRVRLLVIAGDRGMAGGYNANVFRAVREYPGAEILPVGKRACDRFPGDLLYAEFFSGKDASRIAASVCGDFAAGKLDRFGILYTRYESMMQQTACVRWVLPFEPPEDVPKTDLLFEPGKSVLLSQAVPLYVAGTIMSCVRESFCSEVSARRMAMDSAGKNARQMIDDLQLKYNRARQGNITQEITEIVAGSGM